MLFMERYNQEFGLIRELKMEILTVNGDARQNNCSIHYLTKLKNGVTNVDCSKLDK